MPRDVDERKKRAALRKLRKAALLAEQGLGPPLSDWETAFLEEVEARIEQYGSAFADPEKGGEGEALSALQRIKLKEIDKKARGKGRSGFSSRKSKSAPYTPNVRQVDDEAGEAPPRPESKEKARPLTLVPNDSEIPLTNPPQTSPAPAPKRPAFRVIEGGLKKSKPD